MSYEKHDKELQMRIQQYAEVRSIVKSLSTEKTGGELEFLNSRLESYSSFISPTVRMESMRYSGDSERLKYRAEGILGSIWDGIVKLIKYIIRLIDNVIYATRDFVFGKPTGLQNASKAKDFSKTASNAVYTIPENSPLQKILVREGSNSEYVKTAEMIILGIETSMLFYVQSFNACNIKGFLKYAKEKNKKPTPEMAKMIVEVTRAANNKIFAGVKRGEVNATSALRFSARSLMYYENDNYELSPSIYTVPAERFPRSAFEIPGTTVLRCIDLIESVTKELDKLIEFEQKEAKSFLEFLESSVKEKSKQNPDPEEIETLREILALVKNIAVVIGKFQETFKPLRDLKWVDNLTKV